MTYLGLWLLAAGAVVLGGRLLAAAPPPAAPRGTPPEPAAPLPAPGPHGLVVTVASMLLLLWASGPATAAGALHLAAGAILALAVLAGVLHAARWDSR